DRAHSDIQVVEEKIEAHLKDIKDWKEEIKGHEAEIEILQDNHIKLTGKVYSGKREKDANSEL
ncbi:MAG: hypothetical protein KKH98_05340, partial [Spirochaetes bacterium]|nr:hypothetical protein [Spirochaetota bacterium]